MERNDPPGTEHFDPEADALEPYVIDDPEAVTMLSHLEVGKITVTFTQLEALLKILASHLLGDPRFGQIATASLRVESLQHLILAMGRERWGDSASEFRKLANVIEAVDEARIERNKVIHGTWLVEGEGEDRRHTRTIIKLQRKGRKSRLHIERMPFEIDELQRVFESVDQAVESLQSFLVFVFPNFSGTGAETGGSHN